MHQLFPAIKLTFFCELWKFALFLFLLLPLQLDFYTLQNYFSLHYLDKLLGYKKNFIFPPPPHMEKEKYCICTVWNNKLWVRSCVFYLNMFFCCALLRVDFIAVGCCFHHCRMFWHRRISRKTLNCIRDYNFFLFLHSFSPGIKP